MNLFTDLGINFIPHFAPLHYLPFIARTKSLKSKPALIKDGFDDSHFRSKSKNNDVKRGFSEYAFLTLSQNPRIVKAKLLAGFPHIAVNAPAHAFQNVQFDISRYNVAMARRMPTSPTGGFPESDTSGRYYDGKSLPIARTIRDKQALLRLHYPKGTMIEILVLNELQLPDDTTITCYADEDFTLASGMLKTLGVTWEIQASDPPGIYNRNPQHVQAVEEFVRHSLEDPLWRGNGIEFDKV